MEKLHIICGTCPIQKEKATHRKCVEDKCSTLQDTVKKSVLIKYMVELEEENNELKLLINSKTNSKKEKTETPSKGVVSE